MKITHYVIKIADTKKYLSLQERAEMSDILEKINAGRDKNGRKENTYIVINTDEPYIQEIIDILKKYGHWDEKVIVSCEKCGTPIAEIDEKGMIAGGGSVSNIIDKKTTQKIQNKRLTSVNFGDII